MKEQSTPTEVEREEAEAIQPIHLLYGVFFIGVLLTFAIYVGLTMLLGAETSVADSYLTGQEYRMPLSSYNEAYYKNETLQQLITKYDYELFGKVNDKNVLVGREGFLFEVVREDNNYNYLRDYLGEYAYDTESLDSIYNFLKLRQTAYNNQGVEYMVAVIPSAQTVYGEYLPTYIQNSAGRTRLSQLADYMKTKDDITFINLTDALVAAKSEGVLYNNTEDSLNSLGQYFVYQALYKALPEQVRTGTRLIGFDEVTLYTHYTDGKTLARTAGISSVVKNETVSLSNSMEFNYLLQELYPNIEITYADHNTDDAVAGQTILLEFSGEWDKIQLMPYFSSTFDDVVYKSSHNFSLDTVETAQPTLVIQFIHEYELSSLTNSNTAQTYNDGLNAGENPFTTTAPEVTGQVWLDDATVCLTGIVEEGSTLTVSGDVADIRTVQSGGTRFFVRIEMGNEEEVVVRLQASAADKNRSKVVKVTVTRGEGTVEPVTAVTVGADSRLFRVSEDHLVLPDTGTLSVLESELNSFVDRVRSYNILKETQFINVIIPQSSAVYADCAPEELQPSLALAAEYREVIRDLYISCGWTVLDLTEDLQSSRDIGKLYFQTEEAWTDYGAYVGYRSLMNLIRRDFRSILAQPLTAYTRVTQTTAGGELSTLLGFEPSEVAETNIHLVLTTDKAAYDQSGVASVSNIRDAFVTMTGNSELPVAIVLRDEAGTQMLESMAQHFRVMIVLPEGETEIADQTLMLFEPDYIIRLSSETTPGLYDWEEPDGN